MTGRTIVNFLTVGCWNIEGIYEKVNGVYICKLEDHTFQKILNKCDILCLQETHVSQTEIIPRFENFQTIPHCREKSANNRYFGGMLIFIRETIVKGVKIGKHFDLDTFEIKLLRKNFGLKQDLRIFFTYLCKHDKFGVRPSKRN